MIKIYLYGHSPCLTVKMFHIYVNMNSSRGCEVPPEAGSLFKVAVWSFFSVASCV